MERLEPYGGVQGYLSTFLTRNDLHSPEISMRHVPVPTPENEFAEGKRLMGERKYFQRNPQLVTQAKETYGYTCQVCNFNFQTRYGELGSSYIECHHLNPLSERSNAEHLVVTRLEDVAVVCSNCHRMLHRRRPALTLEELRMTLTLQQG
jgi:5-methylcytosine-specific restriction enzyme A